MSVVVEARPQEGAEGGGSARRPDGPLARLLERQDPKPVIGLLDLLAVLAGLIASYIAVPLVHEQLANRPAYLAVSAGALAVYPLLLGRHRLYTARCITRPVDETRRIAGATALGAVALAAIAQLLKADVSRAWVLSTMPTVFVMLSIERLLVRRTFDQLRASGARLRPVVIVGGNTEARALCHMLQRERRLGYEVVGFVDDDLQAAGAPVLGTIASTLDVVRRTGATGVVVAASAVDLGTSNKLVRTLTDEGIHVELSSTLHDISPNRLTVRPLGRFPVVYIEPVLRHGWRRMAKRCFDVVVAAISLIVTAPVLIAAAIAIKLDSRGPVLFRQERVGRDGRPFHVLKLRTMRADAEDRLSDLLHLNEADGPLFKLRDDPRVTRVGRILRSTSIDELPQLFNVLRNEMSLVGPRPALPREVASWDPELHQRLRVLPGITGAWQVSGRADASFTEYARLDLYYVDNWSLLIDVAILLKTLPAVLLRKGAR